VDKLTVFPLSLRDELEERLNASGVSK
jgi:hypothetical protein